MNPNKRQKRNLRNIARRRIGALLREFGGKCAWCDREILTRGQITGKVVKEKPNTVHWLRDGVVVVSHLATVDHLTPISQNGCSRRWNLVPACAPCNNRRQQRGYAKFFRIRESVWYLRQRLLRGELPQVVLVT